MSGATARRGGASRAGLEGASPVTKTSGAAGAGQPKRPPPFVLYSPVRMSSHDARECPFCRRPPSGATGRPARRAPRPRAAAPRAREQPVVAARGGAVRRCAAAFATAFADAARTTPASRAAACPILPTPVRLGASEGATGRGVTVAFLDAGFYAHPDLVRPARPHPPLPRRQAAAGDPARELLRPDVSSWHGMMTSVVACGNGWLSERPLPRARGRGATRAREGRLRAAHPPRRHPPRHRVGDRATGERFDIRVVNISLRRRLRGELPRRRALAGGRGRATRAGHRRRRRRGQPRQEAGPPRAAAGVGAVGASPSAGSTTRTGCRSRATTSTTRRYGPTVDGLQKPEVIAPGIYVAAPILPGTPTAEQAALYARLAAAPDDELAALLAGARGTDPDLDAAACTSSRLLLRQLDRREGARQQRHLGRVQARRRHQLRGADRRPRSRRRCSRRTRPSRRSR